LNNYDWVLSFKLPGVTYVRWMKVDFVIPMSKKDKEFYKDFPFQAVQVYPLNFYRPPFTLDTAFRKAIKAFGVGREPPPKQLLERIVEKRNPRARETDVPSH
jgi:hypothetical protein